MVEIKQSGGSYGIFLSGEPVARILPEEGASERFEKLEEGAYRWIRTTEKPVDHMRMELINFGEPDFTMVPSVSYNGNGWGDFPEYIGDRDTDGTPWSFASHRVTIPACTYSENARVSISLMAEPNSNSACSLYKVEEGERHVLIFPEEEKPRTLQRHFWAEAFQGTMEPATRFTAILQVVPSDGTKHRYKHLMDFAWRYYGHAIKPEKSAAEIYRLSLAYTRYLYGQEKKYGFYGFTSGTQWWPATRSYRKKEHYFEIGWVGQAASMAAACIYDFFKNGDKVNYELGISALDSWLALGVYKNGIIRSSIDFGMGYVEAINGLKPFDPDDYGEDACESIKNAIARGRVYKVNEFGGRVTTNDACNLGTGAEGFFEAYDLLKAHGIERPDYLKTAIDACEFALSQQKADGSFYKSWDSEGKVISENGTIGCFLCLPLISAYQHTNERRYLDSAIRAFDKYESELEEYGFTTAGALDTYSIDKESSSPLLRVAVKLYKVTKEERFKIAAEKIGWYLTTWMMHFTVKYPENCLIHEMGFDTFGMTSVSTPHQALDQYALRDVLSFLSLYEMTGNIQWRERAIAFWCSACQYISDGTYFLNKRLRPAGSQDEAVFHTRWGRRVVPPFSPSQWLPAWPCAFRLENLRWMEDWSVFDEGLSVIRGKIG